MHITLRARREVAQLRAERVFAAVRVALGRAQRETFRIVHFSVQRDHVHLLVEAPDGARLRSGVQGLATRIARAVNRAFARPRGSVWSDRYHRRDLRTPREVRNALVYVLMNHRKHVMADVLRHPAPDGTYRVRGTQETALVWTVTSLDRRSSAAWLDGWSPRAGPYVRALLDEDVTGDARPVVEPLTWLARVGWRRYGTLEPDECPRSHGRGWLARAHAATPRPSGGGPASGA